MGTEQIETVVIGGGQAGLAMSYHLRQRGLEHVVLERGRIGERWRSERWDSLTLLTPNWMTRLPGFEYEGPDRDGFMDRDAIVGFLEGYVASTGLSARCGVAVEALQQKPGSNRYLVRTSEGVIEALNVVVATGPFQKSKVTLGEGSLPPSVRSVPLTDYRNPNQLPAGAVLVVGSGSSGCQICEEIYESGRQVYFSIGHCDRRYRRYRGRDHMDWGLALGTYDETVDRARAGDSTLERTYRCRNQLTGARGGRHELNYDRFARDGVVFVGRLRGTEGDRVSFQNGVPETLRRWDESAEAYQRIVDKYIEENGISAPPHDNDTLSREWRKGPFPCDLSFAEHGITSVIWAAGFTYDFDWIKLPAFASNGSPVHRRGVTELPGMYFLGLAWLHKFKSSFVFGADEDASFLADHILGRK